MRINIPIILLSFSFFSCGSDEAKKTDATNDTAKAQVPVDSVTSNTTKNFFYSLPSPLTLAGTFKSSGMKYVDGLMNDPKSSGKYAMQLTRAFNLGVYNADLAYAVLNGQNQAAMNCLDASKSLSDGLGMGSIFNTESFASRFKKNIGNTDSLATIISELKQEADFFLYDNNRQFTALTIFTGAWTEAMYIATRSVTEQKNDKIRQSIADQHYVIENLMTLLSDYQQEKGFKPYFDEISAIRNLFNALTVKAVNDKETVQMTDTQLKEIAEKVAAFRKKITS